MPPGGRAPQAEFLLTAVSKDGFVRDDRRQVAFIGRSNVGKSTLLNQLLGRRGLARTSSRPGRTQAVNYFLVDGRYYFVDLPGYGFAKASRDAREQWARLIEDYFHASRDRVLLVHLVDSKVGATDLDLQAAEYLDGFAMPRIVIATKIDKVTRSRRAAARGAIATRLDLESADEVIAFSAKSGEGTPQVWNAIRTFLKSELRNEPGNEPGEELASAPARSASEQRVVR